MASPRVANSWTDCIHRIMRDSDQNHATDLSEEPNLYKLGQGVAELVQVRLRGGSVSLDLLMEPGTGVGPDPIGRPRRNAKDSSGFGNRQAAEITQLDELSGSAVRGRKLGQRLVERQQVLLR